MLVYKKMLYNINITMISLHNNILLTLDQAILNYEFPKRTAG